MLIDTLNKIREMIGMDENYFYPLLFTSVVTVMPFIKSIYLSLNNKKKNNLLDLNRTEESDFFYVWIVLIEVVIFLLEIVVLTVVISIITVLFPDLKIFPTILINILNIFLSLFLVNKLMKTNFVRKRVLGNSSLKWLFYFPIILLNISWYCTSIFPLSVLPSNVLIVLFAICEFIGIINFQGRYVRYQHSSLTLFTQNGDKIECEDISKIKREKQTLIIVKDCDRIYIRYDDISRIEYKGEEMIKLKNSLFIKDYKKAEKGT